MKKLYLALAAAGALLLAVLGFARCNDPGPPAPLPVASPVPAATAIASSSTAATASQAVKVTLRRPVAGPHAPQIKSENRNGEPETLSGSGGSHAHDFEEIVIEVSQTATAAASSEASAVTVEGNRLQNVDTSHARLGAFIGTVPGAIALTYQVADVEIPPWVVGTPIELGLEVEGNLAQVGAGVSVGGKGFATAGGWLGFHGGSGWYLGIGLRF